MYLMTLGDNDSNINRRGVTATLWESERPVSNTYVIWKLLTQLVKIISM